jgi:fructose-1,6-bisphosphatase I
LTEQAGGIATDGKNRILELKPEELHQRAPFVCGSPKMVEKVMEFEKEFS